MYISLRTTVTGDAAPVEGEDRMLRVLVGKGLCPETCGVVEKAQDSGAVHL